MKNYAIALQVAFLILPLSGKATISWGKSGKVALKMEKCQRWAMNAFLIKKKPVKKT